MSKKIEYNDLIELGFKRFEMSYEVDFKKHGHYPVGLTLKLKNRYEMEWMDEERKVKLTKVDRDGFIKSTIVMRNLKDVQRHANLFQGKSNDKIDKPEPLSPPFFA